MSECVKDSFDPGCFHYIKFVLGVSSMFDHFETHQIVLCIKMFEVDLFN